MCAPAKVVLFYDLRPYRANNELTKGTHCDFCKSRFALLQVQTDCQTILSHGDDESNFLALLALLANLWQRDQRSTLLRHILQCDLLNV